MGRFYRTSKLPLIDTTYHEPLDYLLKGVTLDTTYRDATVQAADAQNKALKEIKHLNLDPENKLLEQTIDPYQERIDELANMAYTSSDYGEMNKGVRSLSNDIYDDMQTGQLSQIIDRYNTVANWQKNNAELLKSDPDTYNRLYALQIGQMEQGIASDPNFKMSWENGIATPDFQKQFIDVANKLIPDANVRVDGNGYIISDKNLSPERLMSVWQAIWNDPKTRRWAIQQDKIGTPGLISRDANGNPIGFVSPFVNVYNGEPISMEEIAQLPNEEKEKVGRALNPDWYLAELAGRYTAAEAYNQRDLKVDPVWQTRFLEAGRNSRAAQQERGKWNRFLMGREDKQKENRQVQSSYGPVVRFNTTYADANNNIDRIANYNNRQAGTAVFDNKMETDWEFQRAIRLILDAKNASRKERDKLTEADLRKEIINSGDVANTLRNYLDDKEVKAYARSHRGRRDDLKYDTEDLQKELDSRYAEIERSTELSYGPKMEFLHKEKGVSNGEAERQIINILKNEAGQFGALGSKIVVKRQSNKGEQHTMTDAEEVEKMILGYIDSDDEYKNGNYYNRGGYKIYELNYTDSNGNEIRLNFNVADSDINDRILSNITETTGDATIENYSYINDQLADTHRLETYGLRDEFGNIVLTPDEQDMIWNAPLIKQQDYVKNASENIASLAPAVVSDQQYPSADGKSNRNFKSVAIYAIGTDENHYLVGSRTIDLDAALKEGVITGGSDADKINLLVEGMKQSIINPKNDALANLNLDQLLVEKDGESLIEEEPKK